MLFKVDLNGQLTALLVGHVLDSGHGSIVIQNVASGHSLRHVISQPWDQLVEAEPIGFAEAGDETPSIPGVGRETRTVDFRDRLSQSAAASSIRSA